MLPQPNQRWLGQEDDEVKADEVESKSRGYGQRTNDADEVCQEIKKKAMFPISALKVKKEERERPRSRQLSI